MIVMQLFGQYTISSNPPELRQGGRLVRLSPKQFGVLASLIHARGKTVSKDTLLRNVWQGRMVEESNLSQTVFLIRRALGKLPDGTDYIRDYPGSGVSTRFGRRSCEASSKVQIKCADPG